MKKFIAFYYAPAEVMAGMAEATPEQKAEGMKPWMAWNAKVGDNMIDLGSPLMPGSALDASGSWTPSTKELTGYSIVQADNVEAAQALFAGHPHLGWAPGTSIEVHEFAPM